MINQIIRVFISASFLIFILTYGGIAMSMEYKSSLLLDFEKSGNADGWVNVDDTVMGGVSRSTFGMTKERNAVFSGNISLDNYGGFASVINEENSYDLSGYEGVELRIKGDGNKYKFYMKNDDNRDTTLYQTVFLTERGNWMTVKIPFADFIPTFRGQVLNDAPKLDVKKISAMGFLISDKQEGQFSLELKSISTFGEKNKETKLNYIFPEVAGANLEGKKYKLPGDFEGEFNLLFIAYYREQQQLVDTWLPFAKTLSANNDKLKYYELPTIENLNILYQWYINYAMRSGIQDVKAREATITLYIDKAPFNRALGVENEQTIYVLLVDNKGNVLFKGEGAFSEDKGEKIKDIVK